ncbi:hypothetical protein BU23DRAFT_490978 [Bimuria novae-zelandiae CBS 107.79]|uniref:HAD-like protein n=1 Tax=Bimuria novae-zelandiae CBS 107.79 TaxID=1447943 RepID=A0A6A5UJF7_9PLEO|nr:hypothetical protein BU23DRAFT_490978 [Bimuria novae-zelandiae CBS 107.79]
MSRPLIATNQPIDWYLDWDGTITKDDTLDALVNIAVRKKIDANIQEQWESLGFDYMVDYSEIYGEYIRDLPTTVPAEKEFLKAVEAAERRSVDRVSDSGIFQGLNEDDIKDGAKDTVQNDEVQIRPGYVDFVKNLMHWDRNIEQMTGVGTIRGQRGQKPRRELFTILSVNWSARFIEECLKSAAAWGGQYRKKPTICANELENIPSLEDSERRRSEYDGPGDLFPEAPPSTGRIVPGPGQQSRIIFSRDKLERFSRTEAPNADGNPVPKVYIGDSWTDLECLLAADLGICIRDDPMGGTQQKLAQSLDRLGIECPRLLDILYIEHEEPKANDWSIVWARDFREIMVWLHWRSMSKKKRKDTRRDLRRALESGHENGVMDGYLTDPETDQSAH